MKNLGDEHDVGWGLANRTAAIVGDESRASHASGANIPVATRTVSHPVQYFRTRNARIVHGLCSPLGLIKIGRNTLMGVGDDVGFIGNTCNRSERGLGIERVFIGWYSHRGLGKESFTRTPLRKIYSQVTGNLFERSGI